MTIWEEAEQALRTAWGKDTVLALGTRSGSDKINVRNIDGCYQDGAVYVVTYAASHKMQDIAAHPEVGLCGGLSVAQGMGENLGHPLVPENSALRDTLRQVFASFYDKHNNEQDPLMCFLRIRLTQVVLFANDKRYVLDFDTREASATPFINDIVLP